MPEALRTTEQGNALWFILIAIVLLALLTAMLTRSGGSTNDTGDYERANIIASEILTYTNSIENAVQSLLARGCSENEINMHPDSDGDGDYTDNEGWYTFLPNTNSPADFSCHVFHPNGAGLTYLNPFDEDWLVDRSPPIWPYGGIITTVRVIGQGSDDYVRSATELLIFIPSFKKELCLQVNNIVGIENAGGEPPRDTTSSAYERGYNAGFTGVAANTVDAAGLNGSKVGCFVTDNQAGASNSYDGSDVYYFYHAILAR